MTKKTEESKEFTYYTVEVNVDMPVTFTYKVLAESEENAQEIVIKKFPNITLAKPPKLDYSKVIKRTISIFKNGYLSLAKRFK
jgi:hypothetical protein